ncbi:MAG: DUF3343 domain-containing protein [Thermoleophilia bacterium]|nr:DUF3343 domain-containing protein [Thermoleophilia bacterium]
MKQGDSRSGATHTIFLVPSASHATKGETALLRAGVACALIPVPRTLSSQCGVCLRVDLGARAGAAQVLAAAGVRVDAIHDLTAKRPDPRLHDQRGDRR